jgi:hypothetical protein
LQTVAEPEIEPDAAGSGLTVIANAGETVPLPQEFWGWTVRLPEVAVVEKEIVTEFPVPLIVAPVPEYDQV